MTTSNSTNFALNAQQICEAALRLARVLGIGAGYGNNRFGVGNIDEVRIIEGSPIYTANFTPPTAEY